MPKLGILVLAWVCVLLAGLDFFWESRLTHSQERWREAYLFQNQKLLGSKIFWKEELKSLAEEGNFEVGMDAYGCRRVLERSLKSGFQFLGIFKKDGEPICTAGKQLSDEPGFFWQEQLDLDHGQLFLMGKAVQPLSEFDPLSHPFSRLWPLWLWGVFWLWGMGCLGLEIIRIRLWTKAWEKSKQDFLSWCRDAGEGNKEGWWWQFQTMMEMEKKNWAKKVHDQEMKIEKIQTLLKKSENLKKVIFNKGYWGIASEKIREVCLQHRSYGEALWKGGMDSAHLAFMAREIWVTWKEGIESYGIVRFLRKREESGQLGDDMNCWKNLMEVYEKRQWISEPPPIPPWTFLFSREQLFDWKLAYPILQSLLDYEKKGKLLEIPQDAGPFKKTSLRVGCYLLESFLLPLCFQEGDISLKVSSTSEMVWIFSSSQPLEPFPMDDPLVKEGLNQNHIFPLYLGGVWAWKWSDDEAKFLTPA